MYRKEMNKNMVFRTVRVILSLFLLITLFSCKKNEVPDEIVVEEDTEEQQEEQPAVEPEETYLLKVLDEGDIIFYSSEDYYRYGPSMMEYEDGSIDAWFSSPGNSGSQWDWLIYRHSDDREEWSDETVVLRPTPESKDRCSVCDPGAIYFGGYYYLAYTGTDYYEGQGSYNMAFVARSRSADGPYEKWNGSGWGGDPEPIIYYDGGQDNWGIGEVSFVIKDEDLFIYYTYIDIRDSYIGLFKADLVENWPAAMREKGPVLYRLDHDSVEIVYDEYNDTFYAFSIDGRMLEGSNLVVYESKNGKDFSLIASTKEYIEDYAHNMGVLKSPEGHIDSSKPLLIGYAYGKEWGRWNTKIQEILLSKE